MPLQPRTGIRTRQMEIAVLPVADGGGGSRQHVTSDIRVDPGQIRQFAKFLDEMTGEIGAIRNRLHAYTPEGSEKVSFGEYAGSERAAAQHRETISQGNGAMTNLHRRSDDITEATRRLAGQYDDLEELNRATAAQVTTELNRKRA